MWFRVHSCEIPLRTFISYAGLLGRIIHFFFQISWRFLVKRCVRIPKNVVKIPHHQFNIFKKIENFRWRTIENFSWKWVKYSYSFFYTNNHFRRKYFWRMHEKFPFFKFSVFKKIPVSEIFSIGRCSVENSTYFSWVNLNSDWKKNKHFSKFWIIFQSI